MLAGKRGSNSSLTPLQFLLFSVPSRCLLHPHADVKRKRHKGGAEALGKSVKAGPCSFWEWSLKAKGSPKISSLSLPWAWKQGPTLHSAPLFPLLTHLFLFGVKPRQGFFSFAKQDFRRVLHFAASLEAIIQPSSLMTDSSANTSLPSPCTSAKMSSPPLPGIWSCSPQSPELSQVICQKL